MTSSFVPSAIPASTAPQPDRNCQPVHPVFPEHRRELSEVADILVEPDAIHDCIDRAYRSLMTGPEEDKRAACDRLKFWIARVAT